MSTNYFLRNHLWIFEPDSETGLHIGKSSMGWRFALRVYPELGIHSLRDWDKRFRRNIIVDEYRRVITSTQMIRHICIPSWYPPPGRHLLPFQCVGHGKGPYDYVLDDFR